MGESALRNVWSQRRDLLIKENGEWRQQVTRTGKASERLRKLSEHLWKQPKRGGWRKRVGPKVRVDQGNVDG